MVKKLRKLAEQKAAGGAMPSGLFDSQLASTVRDSAQQIWLAGLGAFSKAQEEGTKVFEALVKEGMTLQRKTRGAAEEKIGEVTGKMSAMANDVTAKAGQQWDKLESIFEARVEKALTKLGVPSRGDVSALSDRLDELSARVAALSGPKARAPRAGVDPAAKKTPAAKRAPRKTAA
jgi:poly(hydroxyalkanoate) granule-associated protein